jgi:L-ascorbate metabolism protein UlaG (beta-lactamase superfamily)
MSVAVVTWLGHSTVRIELDGVTVLTDPVLRRWVMHLRRTHAVDDELLYDLDAVLVSHVHYDHLDLRSLRRLGRAVPVAVPRGAGRLLRRSGFETVVELEHGDEIKVGSLSVLATHAEHQSRRHPFARATPSLGFLLNGTACIYFAGDTDLFDGMRTLAPRLDLALLPVAGWGPRVPQGHLDPARAVEALRLLRPRVAIPVHWGTYRRFDLARDSRALQQPAEAFASLAAERVPDVEVRVLTPGTPVQLSLEHGVAA